MNFIVRFIGSLIKYLVYISVIIIAAGAALFWFDTGSWLVKPLAEHAGSFFLAPAKVEISNVNLSKIKTGKISAIRFSTLEAICKALDCQPGDILEYDPDTKD